MTHSKESEINTLLIRFFENDINDQQRETLLAWAQGNPDACKVYWRFAKDMALIRTQIAGQIRIGDGVFGDQGFDQVFWATMADYEKNAPGIEVPDKKPRRELLQKIVYPPRENRKMNKFSKVFLALNAAAILFIVLFLKFAPPRGEFEVATLADSMNAMWGNAAGSMEMGTRLVPRGDEFFLREGLAALLFDNNVEVVIEGPAEFSLLTEDRLFLQYGRIFVTVPPEGIGFTVNTPTSRIIDLGTEFGVEADTRGDTYLHMIKGNAQLIVEKESDLISINVSRGNAKRVSGLTQTVSDVSCNEQIFVRAFDSASNVVWRGQSVLLADMVGNGNGFGTGTFDIGINPVTGQSGAVYEGDRTASNEYIRTANPYVDGVFIPNGKTKQIVSSQGHVFEECPDTYGNFYLDIGNTPKIGGRIPSLRELLNNEAGNTCLLLHANIGITFDLNAIRSQLPGLRIKQFKSHLCISAAAPGMPNIDFWVLVDGKVRYGRKNVTDISFVDSVTIELHEDDRFLSLATTDGGDPEKRTRSDGGSIKSIDCDWGMFAGPVLVLE